MTTEQATKTIDEQLKELTVQMQAAAAAGNLDAIIAIGKQADALKKSVTKAENEKILARAKELEGARQVFSEKLEKAIRSALARAFPDKDGIDTLSQELNAIEATGLHVIHVREGNKWTFGGTYQAPKAVKTAKGTSTGGGTGKSVQEYGMKLQDIVDKFATEEEKVAIDNAESNSKSWQLKVAVKKRAIEAGLLQPTK
jgi:hypothetical protein